MTQYPEIGARKRESFSAKIYKLYSKSPLSTDHEKVTGFHQVSKVDGVWKTDVSAENKMDSISFFLSKIEHATYNDEKYGLKNILKIFGFDSNGRVIIDCNFNYQTWSILNTLLSDDLDTSEPVQIDVWTQKDKVTKEQNARAKVKYAFSDDNIEWKFEPAIIPKAEKIDVGNGKAVSDMRQVVKFWVDAINRSKLATDQHDKQITMLWKQRYGSRAAAPAQEPEAPKQEAKKSAMTPNMEFDNSPHPKKGIEPENGFDLPPADFMAPGDDDDLPY